MTDTAEPTALALFPKLNLPSVTGITEEMNKSFGTMYTRIEAGIAELPTDMSVAKNRDAVASYAYSISRTKTGLDEAAAGVSGDAKKIVDAVNAERRQLKDTLDMLRDKARAPLDAWQEAEAGKKARAEAAIYAFQNVAVEHAGKDSLELAMVLDNLKRWQFKEETYGERVDDVNAAHAIAVERLGEMFETRSVYEAEQAELEQLRREKAAREEADRLAAEAKAAEEAAAAQAERERIEAEQKAEADRIERERIAEEARQEAAREAQAKIDAEKRKAEEAEAARIAAEEARQRAEEQAKADAFAAAVAAEQEAKAREEAAAEKVRQEQRAEAARIEREKLAQERADQERAADLAHRKKINTAALAALVKVSEITEDQAKMIVTAIAKGQIPHVVITY